jgi:hypothetical protein
MLTYTVCNLLYTLIDICAESEFFTKHFRTYTPHNIKGRATNSVKNNRGSRGWGMEGVIQCSPCPWPIRLGVKIHKRKIVAPD